MLWCSGSVRAFLAAFGFFLAALPAAAQFPGDVPDNFRLRLGEIFANVDSTVRIDDPALPGTLVDLTGEGLIADRKTTFRGEGYWNLAGRTYLDFGYVDYGLSRSSRISRDLNVDGVIYRAGAAVDTDLRTRFLYGGLRYGIVRNKDVHLGLSLGVDYAMIRGRISATANVTRPDGTAITGGATKEREVNAPAPLVGLHCEVRIAGPVTIGAHVRAAAASVRDYSGSWVEGVAELNWFLARNIGIGGAYEYQKVLVKKESASDSFRFDLRYEGPRAFLLITF